jgi:glutathione-regulated potassium-efflux system ancillary protein KefG
MKPAILIIFVHPYPRKSRVNRAMIEAVKDLSHITVHDLYESYPDFNIDVRYEQALLLRHQVLVVQHPMYWYSCPALLKEWQDVVLEYGFAYGPTGTALQGKEWVQVISMGNPANTYRREGRNRFTVEEFLRPFEQTAHLCGMIYRTPFLVQGVFQVSPGQVAHYAGNYRDFLDNYPLQSMAPRQDDQRSEV